MGIVRAILARAIRFGIDGLQGPTNEQAMEILEQRLEQAEARRVACLDALSEHVSPDATADTPRMIRPSSVLAGIRALQARLRDARSDLREHDADLEAANTRAEKLEAELRAIEERGGALREAAAAVRGDAERIASLETDLTAARARIAELEAPLPEATVEELFREFCDARAGVAVASRTAIRAVAERVRRERPPCLIARAVAANIDVRVAEDQGGGFLVVVHRAGEDEDVERNVPAADVPAVLSRMLEDDIHVGAERKGAP